MSENRTSALTFAFLAVFLPSAALAQTVTFQGLGYLPTSAPNGPGSSATAVSADGMVVSGNANSGAGGTQAFRWSNGVLTGLGFPVGSHSQASGTNANGGVIVGISANPSAAQVPIIWTNGVASQLPQAMNTLSMTICGALVHGVSANSTGLGSSVVVGQDPLNPGGGSCPPGRAVAWVNGTEGLLFPDSVPTPGFGAPSGVARGTSANGSVIVGEVGHLPGGGCLPNNSCTQAFRWTSGGYTILGDLGGHYSSAYATNSDGSVIVGTAAINNVNSQPFRWTAAGGLVGLGGESINATAFAVNADGSVVVGQAFGKAFRWTASTGLQYIQDLLVAAGINLNGWGLTQATGLSADGATIVGTANSPTGGQAWIARLPLAPPPPPPPPLACPSTSRLSDFNGDVRADMLFRRNDGLLSLYFMNGLQITSAAVVGQVGTEWTLVGIGDFNADGRADLLMRRGDGTLAIFLMNGAQVVAAQLIGNIGNEWKIVGVGDFNGDGRADILTRRTADGTMGLYLMNGFQMLAGAVLGNIGLEWTVAQIADFNGDGRADFLTRRSDGTLAVYLMSGFQFLSAAIIGNVGTDWKLVAAGDFSGDGRADFLTRRTDGTLAIYLLNGLQLLGAQVIGNVGLEWQFIGNGDLNADGRSDLVFRRPDGTLSGYLINGFAITGAAILGNVGTEWGSCYGQGGGGIARVSLR